MLFRSLSSGPLRHPGTCRRTTGLMNRPSTACFAAASPPPTSPPAAAEAVASPPSLSLDSRQQHTQNQSQGLPARPATAQPSSGTRGRERRLELLQRCRPPLGSASSLIVETDDVALQDRHMWSPKGHQSGPYEDARKRQGRFLLISLSCFLEAAPRAHPLHIPHPTDDTNCLMLQLLSPFVYRANHNDHYPICMAIYRVVLFVLDVFTFVLHPLQARGKAQRIHQACLTQSAQPSGAHEHESRRDSSTRH